MAAEAERKGLAGLAFVKTVILLHPPTVFTRCMFKSLAVPALCWA